MSRRNNDETKTFITQAGKQGTLYTKFKAIAALRQMTIAAALKEAMFAWVKKNGG